MAEIIGILGGNGVYARHLVPRLAAAGHTVRVIVRRPEAAGLAYACGAEIAVADIYDVAAMSVVLRGCTVAVNLATSLPGPSGRGDFAANDLVRVVGTPNFVAACRSAGVPRVLQQSIGLVCASGDLRWSDETAVYRPMEDTIAAKAIAAAHLMESSITASGLDWVILRGGLFYGPGTGFDEGWFARAAAGKLRLPGDGSDYVSLIHIADMATATVAALERWPSRRALIVCDDAPAQWRDVFGFIASCAGQEPPRPGGRIDFPSFRLRNAQAAATLGWRPFYRNYREGLAR